MAISSTHLPLSIQAKNPAASALELLIASACVIDKAGKLWWINAEQAAELLRMEQAPSTFEALDLALEGAARRAFLEDKSVNITRPEALEIRANRETGVLVIRALQPQRMFSTPNLPANDPGATMLASALADKRLCLFRQPIISTADQSIIRWECLSRLICEDGRVVLPSEFIPAAERGGLVGALDIETLNLALSALQRDVDIHLAVNVSAATIGDAAANQEYQSILSSAKSLANRLTVEITETIAILNLDTAANFGHSIRAQGARLALDDFGEGHTSFQSLRALPLDEVKIDGTYISAIESRGDSHAFVVAIERLARDLGMETVAECVETAGEVEALRTIGVGSLQGYFYGKPRSGA